MTKRTQLSFWYLRCPDGAVADWSRWNSHAWSKYKQDPKNLSPWFTDEMGGQFACLFLWKWCLFSRNTDTDMQRLVRLMSVGAYLGFGFNYICILGEDISGYWSKANKAEVKQLYFQYYAWHCDSSNNPGIAATLFFSYPWQHLASCSY